MAEQLGLTVKKLENFSEWYTQVIKKAELADYGPVKGSIAIRPYAYALWEKIREIFDRMIKKSGHKNAYFPLFIPESFLKKEAEHFEGFVPEVFWVTQAGNKEVGEKLAIRPTSETIIYHFMSRWIRSWRDLPLLLNQWCNIARAEIKATKPFIRTSEFLWQEGHTAHATQAEAETEVRMILGFYRELIEKYLAIPVIVGKKSETEKFAGAVYTTTLEALMPDGRALQCGTSHYLGQNFSKPFEVKFSDKSGEDRYAYTTCWGISTRLIGALVMVHGDDKGLVIPPNIAPIQIVIIPIYYEKREREKVFEYCKDVEKKLKVLGFLVLFDGREAYTPGWKFNEWELKGVPLRIEAGMKEVENRTVTIVRRDTGEKVSLELEALDKIKSISEKVQKNLFERAKKFLEKNTTFVNEYEKLKRLIGNGFVKANWCGNEKCESKVKEETGATIRAIPFDEEKEGKCVYCGSKTKLVAYFAKAY